MRTVAYLDAGSGSLIAGAIVAGFAGIAVFFKTGFHKIRLLFSPRRRREEKAARVAAAAASGDDS